MKLIDALAHESSFRCHFFYFLRSRNSTNM